MTKVKRGMSNPVRIQTLKKMSLFAPCVPAGFVLERMTKNYRKVLNDFACESQTNINKFASLTAKSILKDAHDNRLITDMEMVKCVFDLEDTKIKKEYLNTYAQEGFSRRCPKDCTYASRGSRTRCRAGFSVRCLGGLMYHRNPCGKEKPENAKAVV